ncbi:thioredoxin [Mycolicibacterium sp. BK556]|uniref:thioredoxin family protein n=1 Tax=unclassified Mycolicibacterium TaxID=2636767 RepID=UPI001607A0FD|nr:MULTISPECIES: thioredoxin family protein [unclassified Mycolicibacterium]MBB3603779.1 thioredoxin [Mycolicibacterium sp. BK556]MBB3633974.1 thioredoxin [Mycolicibacterium sp. BK607]
MDRDYEFVIALADDAVYAIRLLEGVEIEQSDGTTIGRWPAFDLEATADTEAEVYQQLLSDLRERSGTDHDAPQYQPLAAYVREHGTRLTQDDIAARELARLRAISLRWHVTDDEQYMVQLFKDAEVERETDVFTVSAFGLDGNGPSLSHALQGLNRAISDATGEHDKPGPRFDEFTDWVRSHGERVSDEVLAQEATEKQEYLVARDKLTAITPEDIDAESATGVPLLVDFWADWCGPCRMVTPVLAELAERWAGRIVIRKIDVDQFDGVWERFNFRGIPAMIMFKDGEEIHRVLGFGGKKQLVAELEPHL